MSFTIVGVICLLFCYVHGMDAEVLICENRNIANASAKHFQNMDFTSARITHADLRTTSILIGLAAVSHEKLVNFNCHTQLQQIERSVMHKELWALKILDATGTKPPAFMFGHNFWLGSREMCHAANKALDITLSKYVPHATNRRILRDKAPFDVHYSVVYLQHNSSRQVDFPFAFYTPNLHVGLCLPTACTAQEIQLLMTNYVRLHAFVDFDLYDIQPQVLRVKQLKLSAAFYQRISFKLMLAYCSFVILMSSCALWLRGGNARRAEVMTVLFPAKILQHVCKVNDSFYGHLKCFITCFDVQTNWQTLFSLNGNSEFPSIAGLRTFSALTIVIFHLLYFMESTVSNKIAHYVYSERLGNVVIFVDAFYVMSGFLRTHNFLKNNQLLQSIRQNSFTENARKFLKMYLKRLLRICPLYFVTICVSDQLFAYFDDVSIFYNNYCLHEKCAKYWWQNLLFIQNFFDYREVCVLWTWFLATEMQYYLLATLLLFLYAKQPKLVKTIVLLVLCANILWSYSSSHNYQISLESVAINFTRLYTNSFIRVSPYILGAITAWQHVAQPSAFVLSERKQQLLWLCACVVVVIAAFAPLGSYTPVCLVPTMMAFGRLLFALSVCWMLVAPGTCWAHLFDAEIVQHLSKLCYAIYLLNPIVLLCFFGMRDSSAHVQPIELCVWYLGLCLVLYPVALVFTLIFELPYSEWSRRMWLSCDRAESKSN